MSLRTWYAGLDKNGRRIVITLSVLVTLWVVQAFVREAEYSDTMTKEAIEAAAQSRDSARVCVDSMMKARPEACWYYRRPPYFRR